MDTLVHIANAVEPDELLNEGALAENDGDNQPVDPTVDYYKNRKNVDKVLREAAQDMAAGALSWVNVAGDIVRFAAAGTIVDKDAKDCLFKIRSMFNKRMNNTAYAGEDESNSIASNTSKLANIIKLGTHMREVNGVHQGVDVYMRTVAKITELRKAKVDTLAPYAAVVKVAAKQVKQGHDAILTNDEIADLVQPAESKPKTEEQMLAAAIKQLESIQKKVIEAGGTPAPQYNASIAQLEDRIATVVRERELMEAELTMLKYGHTSPLSV